jgi:uncharacterized protein YmfQ (DUF2313 family)
MLRLIDCADGTARAPAPAEGLCGHDAAAYGAMLCELLPIGPAWPAREHIASTQRDVFLALGVQLASFEAAYCSFLAALNPCENGLLIDDWERCLGLPDPCIAVAPTDLATRMAAVCARLRAQGGASFDYIAGVLNALGIGTLTVSPHLTHSTFSMPFPVAFSHAGSNCVDIGGVVGAPGSGALVEHSTLPMPFGAPFTVKRQPDFDLLECTLHRIMPAHICWHYV